MPKIYYGWQVTAAVMAIFTLIMGATYSTYGLYVLPVAQEFGLSRADANSGIILLNIGVALISPFLGPVMDRISVRKVMIVSSLVFIASFLAIGWAPNVLICAAILLFMLPFASKGTGTLSGLVLIARWFTVRRGRAMTISQLGLSAGGLLIAPIAAVLLENYGWRIAAVVTGVACGFLLLLIALVIRDTPAPGELEAPEAISTPASSARGSSGDRAVSWRTVLTSPQFWTIDLACSGVAALTSAMLITVVPLAREKGLSTLEAATLISVWSGFGIGAKILVSVIADWVDRVLLLSLFFIGGGALYFILLGANGYWPLLCVAAGFGLTNAAVPPLQFALLADRFGAASMGTVAGLTVPFGAVLGIMSVRFSGEIFDRTGSYDGLCLAFAVLQVIAAILIFSSRYLRKIPVPHPAQP